MRKTYYITDYTANAESSEQDYIREQKAIWDKWISKSKDEEGNITYKLNIPPNWQTDYRKRSVKLDEWQFEQFVHFVMSRYVVDRMLIETHNDKNRDTSAVLNVRYERLGVGIYGHEYDDGTE
jgi:hypothetical protein